ncbi:S1 RNA-binding domain-containing protein [Actinoplanes sp. OR16]|uniref:S1 RNA-binding domain-containing protein n=1 Tax=Actinoplanes sp. OR16 TaxID=946334 RepID=UPI00351A0EDD
MPGSPKRGTVVRGTVSEIHNFGVFVRLEGEPADLPGSGFMRIPELSWEYFDDPADVHPWAGAAFTESLAGRSTRAVR